METNVPVRRNDPCPCGSGRRYKECHGKLEAAPPAAPVLLHQALQLHRRGQVDEAERIYEQVLAGDAGNAIATHYLGMVAWHRGDLAKAESLMREALRRDASIPDFHNNLGLLLRDTRRLDEAVACFRATLAVDGEWIEAYNNLGLALEAAGDSQGAVDAYRTAVARQPQFAVAQQNLARALLARGEFPEAWERYRWRLAAQGLAATPPDAQQHPLGPALDGRRFALHGEQGIGDVLFFLRFVPELVKRGARVAFRGDMRLAGMLERTGLFAGGIEAAGEPAPGMEAIFVGDLPWLLGANDPARFPPPLALKPLEDRAQRWRDTLRSFGPAPCVALTWRAGTASRGPVNKQLKEVPPDVLGEALRDTRATWISVQRLPLAGEREALERSLGAPIHDCSAANDDLEEILALIGAVDDYVGVSNANTHLRAATGGSMRVLVPWPPEWRWMLDGPRSPWFPAMRVARQSKDGRWETLHRG